jgi:hypothetical protein
MNILANALVYFDDDDTLEIENVKLVRNSPEDDSVLHIHTHPMSTSADCEDYFIPRERVKFVIVSSYSYAAA